MHYANVTGGYDAEAVSHFSSLGSYLVDTVVLRILALDSWDLNMRESQHTVQFFNQHSNCSNKALCYHHLADTLMSH